MNNKQPNGGNAPPSTEAPRKLGRKVKEIDFEQLEKLCFIQCTLEEIAGWFKVSEDTIERRVVEHYGERFADVQKKHASGGKISIRRLQFRLAEKTPALAIWLGKQYLGQSDKSEYHLDLSKLKELPDEQLERLARGKGSGGGGA